MIEQGHKPQMDECRASDFLLNHPDTPHSTEGSERMQVHHFPEDVDPPRGFFHPLEQLLQAAESQQPIHLVTPDQAPSQQVSPLDFGVWGLIAGADMDMG